MEHRPSCVDVSIILVFYEDPAEIRVCIESLPEACPGTSYEVKIIDNSPKQILEERMFSGFTHVELSRSGGNVGLARATNLALRRAVGRYYLCLNPDVIATPESITKLVAYGDATPDAGIIGVKLVNPDLSLQYSCRRFYTLGHVLVRRTLFRNLLPAAAIDAHHLMMNYDHQTARDVDWLLGSCLLVRAAAEKEVGPMDPGYFLYFEDVDWCYRMHQAGWRVIYFPDAHMIHAHKRESASAGFSRQKRAHIASFFRFHRRHGWRVLCGNRGNMRTSLRQRALSIDPSETGNP